MPSRSIRLRASQWFIWLAIHLFSLPALAESNPFSSDCGKFITQLTYMEIEFHQMNLVGTSKPKKIVDLESFLEENPKMLDCTNKFGERPLGVLLETASTSEVRFHIANFLIEKGAAVDFVHSDGRNPIGLLIWAYVAQSARSNGMGIPIPKTLDLLVENGASVKQPNALKYCEFCPVTLLKRLIHLGADPTQEFDSAFPAKKGWTLIHYYSDQAISPPQGIRFLVTEAHVDVNLQASGTGETPLHLAARKCALEKVSILLKLGADPVRSNYNGETPLSLVGQNYRDQDEQVCNNTQRLLEKMVDQMALGNQ